MSRSLRREIEEDRKRRLEDIIRYARWEAEMARRRGRNGLKYGMHGYGNPSKLTGRTGGIPRLEKR